MHGNKQTVKFMERVNFPLYNDAIEFFVVLSVYSDWLKSLNNDADFAVIWRYGMKNKTKPDMYMYDDCELMVTMWLIRKEMERFYLG